MESTEIIMLIILFFIGAIFGSFACCQAWRLRLKQTGKKNPGKWSVCLSCGKRLKPSENIPVFSWIAQRGKCKHCGANIGVTEILAEVSLGLCFVVMGIFFYPEVISALTTSTSWYPVLLFSIMLVLIISIIIMWILAIYDLKWSELPVRLLTILNICAIIYTILRFVGVILSGVSPQNIASDLWSPLASTLGSVAILAGTYFCLYFFSKEKLVGSGDWLIALPIALLLGNWWLALVALFISNALGSVYGFALKLRHRDPKQIPFGPFLVAGFVIVYVAQNWLLSLITIL